MKIFANKEGFWRRLFLAFISVAIASALSWLTVLAVTTLSTNISTDGTLSVTGTSTLTGVANIARIDRSGAISIGTSSATGVTISRSTILTTVAGSLSVSGTSTFTTTTFSGAVTLDVPLGVANGGTATSTTPSNNAVLLGTGSVYALSQIPDCQTGSTDKLLFNSSTRVFSCGADQNSGVESGFRTNNPFVYLTTSTTQVGLGATSSVGYKLFVQSTAVGSTTAMFQGLAAQTADLFQVASSSGAIYFQVSNLGIASSTEFRMASATITGLTANNTTTFGANLTGPSSAWTILGSGTNAVTLDTGGAAGLNLGNTNANALTISRSGIVTTVAGTLSVTGTSTLTGVVDLDRLDRSGAISIGTSSATGVRIGRSGFVTTIGGTLSVTGTSTFTGAQTFSGLATLSGGATITNPTIGSGGDQMGDIKYRVVSINPGSISGGSCLSTSTNSVAATAGGSSNPIVIAQPQGNLGSPFVFLASSTVTTSVVNLTYCNATSTAVDPPAHNMSILIISDAPL